MTTYSCYFLRPSLILGSVHVQVTGGTGRPATTQPYNVSRVTSKSPLSTGGHPISAIDAAPVRVSPLVLEPEKSAPMDTSDEECGGVAAGAGRAGGHAHTSGRANISTPVTPAPEIVRPEAKVEAEITVMTQSPPPAVRCHPPLCSSRFKVCSTLAV